VKHVGSTGEVTKSVMRQVGMGYRVANQTFDILVLSCVLVTIWWVLVGGGLGEAEDEDDEKDSSTGASGGGGEGVCEGGGGGGEESMMGPAEEEGTEIMEGKRDVEMEIDGEGVEVGGERGQRRLEKKRRTRRTQHPGRCKYDQRGHANIDNLYVKPSNLRRHIGWIENQTYEFGMDVNEDGKHNQKYVRKGNQVLHEIIFGKEIDCGGRG